MYIILYSWAICNSLFYYEIIKISEIIQRKIKINLKCYKTTKINENSKILIRDYNIMTHAHTHTQHYMQLTKRIIKIA